MDQSSQARNSYENYVFDLKEKNRTPQKPTKQKPHTKQIPTSQPKNRHFDSGVITSGKIRFLFDILSKHPKTMKFS